MAIAKSAAVGLPALTLGALLSVLASPASAGDPGTLFGTNGDYGGNINNTNGVTYNYLESITPIGNFGAAVTAKVLVRDNVGDFTETYIVSCSPSYGTTGVTDLKSGEIYSVEPFKPQPRFTSIDFFYDLWHTTCLGKPDIY
jgi:hypothetical protein